MADRVLVTDAQERKAVPVIRALGRAGVYVVAGESCRWAMGFSSKYCRERYVYPRPEDEEAFVAWLLQMGRRGVFNVVLPVDDRTMAPITRYRRDLEAYARIPVVDHHTYLLARDKAKTMEVARKVGVAIPETWWFASPEECADRLDEVPCPAVIKPRIGSGSRGIRCVHRREGLLAAYQEVHRRYPNPLVQEFVPPGGETLGVELLLNEGVVVAQFMHRRLREYPLSGGPSTLRESTYDGHLIHEAARLLSHMGWHGVAMVEFKIDPRDRVAKLMEVNPKFWGSVALPIVAGVNFPLLLYKLAKNETPEKMPAYALRVRSRWLIPGDLLHFITNPDRWRLEPSFFQFRGIPDDILERDDLGPLYGMLLSFLSRAFTKALWTEKVLRWS